MTLEQVLLNINLFFEAIESQSNDSIHKFLVNYLQTLGINYEVNFIWPAQRGTIYDPMTDPLITDEDIELMEYTSSYNKYIIDQNIQIAREEIPSQFGFIRIFDSFDPDSFVYSYIDIRSNQLALDL